MLSSTVKLDSACSEVWLRMLICISELALSLQGSQPPASKSVSSMRH